MSLTQQTASAMVSKFHTLELLLHLQTFKKNAVIKTILKSQPPPICQSAHKKWVMGNSSSFEIAQENGLGGNSLVLKCQG